MTQLLIDIAALMPSDSPLPGTMLPATGAACVCAPGQETPFADALNVLLGQSGKAVPTEPSDRMLAKLPTLPGQSLPVEQAIQWFDETATDSRANLQTDAESDNPKQQQTGDLSQFLSQPVLTGVQPAPPMTITLADETAGAGASEIVEASAAELPGIQIATGSEVQSSGAETAQTRTTAPIPEPAISFASGTVDTTIDQPTVTEPSEQLSPTVTDAQAQINSQESIQGTESNKAGKQSEPILANPVIQDHPAQPPASTPVTTGDPKATVTVEVATAEMQYGRGEAPANTSAPAHEPAVAFLSSSDAKAAADSLVQAVNRIGDDDVPLKVEITPGQFAEKAQPEAERADTPSVKLSRDTATVLAKTPSSSTTQAGTTPKAEVQQQPQSVQDVHKALPTEEAVTTPAAMSKQTAKTVPMAESPTEAVEAKIAKVETPIQPIAEFESKQTVGQKRTGKTEATSSGRVNPGVTVAKPAAVPAAIVDTPAQDAGPVASKTPVNSADPLEVPGQTNDDTQAQPARSNTNGVNNTQSQTQTAHSASTAIHAQAMDHAERIDAPPPVRFEIEVPKPLRVPGQIRVHLDPPELGQVRIDLASRGDGVVGSLRFQSEQARHIVEREIGQLQKTLQDAGVRVERLEVLSTTSSNSRTSPHTNMNNHQSWSQNTTSQDAFNGGTRGHAGMHSPDTAPEETAQAPIPARIAAYPSMHAGTVNLVA